MRMTLEAARVNVGLSQTAAAKALKITEETLRAYEKYRKSPRVELAIRMTEIYKCGLSDLIFLKEDIA